MYYDALKKKVLSSLVGRSAGTPVSVVDCIAPCYYDLHREVQNGTHSVYYLPGGRGSGKSSFVSVELVDGIMKDPEANGIVFRKYANTLRESVFSQIGWAIEMLGVSNLWRGSVSPMQYTYLPTGQQIFFRGLDDASKLKSIKAKRGVFKYVWFEELSELNGANQVRSVLQSVVRGGTGFKIFSSFNPPMSANSWANKYILIPDDRAIVFRTDYEMMPPEWLGEAFLLEAERLREINETAWRHEYKGEPTGTGGEVFPNITIREIPEDEASRQQYIYQGLDFGFSVDPFAFIRLSYDRRTQTVYLLDEIVKRGCSNADIADLIKGKSYNKTPSGYTSIFGDGEMEGKTLIICDAAEPKSIADLQNSGLKAIACKKYAGSVMYGIKWLQSKKIVMDPARTPVAYKEFTEYEYLTTKDGEFLAEVPDKDNHLIDAVRYALDRLINNKDFSA